MKKLTIFFFIIFGLSLCSFAQDGLFGYGESKDASFSGARGGGNEALVNMPGAHGLTTDSSAPLGSGALLLIGFGAAYALRKRKGE